MTPAVDTVLVVGALITLCSAMWALNKVASRPRPCKSPASPAPEKDVLCGAEAKPEAPASPSRLPKEIPHGAVPIAIAITPRNEVVLQLIEGPSIRASSLMNPAYARFLSKELASAADQADERLVQAEKGAVDGYAPKATEAP